jgi:hypothetical protein
MKLDKEEQDILSAYDEGRLKLSSPSSKETEGDSVHGGANLPQGPKSHNTALRS